MPRWDISPSGVQGVLGQTEGVAQDFEPQMRAMNAALEGAAGESSSEIVAGALSGFATDRTYDTDSGMWHIVMREE